MNGFNFQLDTPQGVEVPKNANTLREIMAKVEPKTIQNGEYEGLISGYLVEFIAHGINYCAEAKDGVRGINCKVTVVVSDGVIYVK